jgi:hypothetical protein
MFVPGVPGLVGRQNSEVRSEKGASLLRQASVVTVRSNESTVAEIRLVTSK